MTAPSSPTEPDSEPGPASAEEVLEFLMVLQRLPKTKVALVRKILSSSGARSCAEFMPVAALRGDATDMN